MAMSDQVRIQQKFLKPLLISGGDYFIADFSAGCGEGWCFLWKILHCIYWRDGILGGCTLKGQSAVIF
jgi:hypothetical protein